MFHWCQKVNVYNIENHYHFYSNKEQEPKEQPNLSYKKLKVGSISFMSTNTKRSSKSCIKKGLNLSKKLSMSFNPQQASSIFQIKKINSHNQQPFTILQHIRSASKSIGEQFKQKIHDIQNNNSKQMLTASHESFRPDQQFRKLQKIDIKRKPSMLLNKKQQNSALMQKLYLTTPHPAISKNINNIKYLQISPVQKCENIHEMTTSRNMRSKDASILSESAQHSEMDSNQQKNSKYNVSIFDSLSYSDKRQVGNEGNNEHLYHKFLEVSRGQARQASIILSNILSRSNDKNYSSSHQRTYSILSHKKRFNLQDKQTILSHQNDATSMQSVKIQESELCDLDPKNNFQIIPNKSFKNSIYSVDLAIENFAKCVVSLKQVGFREMSSISQELQIYQFVEQVLSTRDTYHNILQLYQVQTTGSSYLLIKQPYTHSFYQYLQNLSPEKIKQFSMQLETMVKQLLVQFAHHMMYPCRLLCHTDFVICESVIKIHDLSVFKQTKNPPFTIDQVLQSLYINNSNTMTKGDTDLNQSFNSNVFEVKNNLKYQIRVNENN